MRCAHYSWAPRVVVVGAFMRHENGVLVVPQLGFLSTALCLISGPWCIGFGVSYRIHARLPNVSGECDSLFAWMVRFVSNLECNFFNFVPEHRVGVVGPIVYSPGRYIAMYRLRIVIVTLGREIFRSK